MNRAGHLLLLLLLIPSVGACLPAPGSGGSVPLIGTGGASGQGEAGRDSPTTSDGGAPPVALPLVVTDYFDNQGWVGDSGIMTLVHTRSTVVLQFGAHQGRFPQH